MIKRPRLRAVCLGVLAATLLAGCAGTAPAPDSSPTYASVPAVSTAAQPPTPTPVTEASTPASVGKVATVIGDSISPLTSPDGTPVADLTNPMREGVPLVFLVVGEQDDWLEVQLPIRPNGSTGWVRESDVTLNSLTYSLDVSIAERTVILNQDGEEVQRFEAAIGTGDTPTPVGEFYITELLVPTNEGYGPYAFGLSAFSDVLNSYGGGPGQIGLHGTPDASSIGQAVSHGCIRLHNDDITYLAEILPLGTPISIE